ncbi:MAG: alpha/beta hydrolase [Deltaproteobacteria bacterium]|nr:alpha/beta hydrolase [Deltaproteobacteria bacterium]
MPKKLEKCEVTGGRMAFWRSGSGEPVLLVHGITTYSFIWRRITPCFGRDYDVIAVDLLGCGDSDMPPDADYSLSKHAERLHELVLALDLKKFHFVGHDLGGGIGQIFAVRWPEMLFDLTLINTVAHDFWPVQPITAMRTPIVRLLLMATMDRGLLKSVVRQGLFHKENQTPELMALFSRPFKEKAGRRAFLRFAGCLDNQDLVVIENDLKKPGPPVMVVRGDADRYLSATIAEKLARDIPGCRLERIATAGHYLQEDEPDLLSSLLLDFFQSHANV